MSRLGDRLTGAGAVRQRWEKYSLAYQRRLLEGGRSMQEFFKKKGFDWDLIQHGKSRLIDEVLEQFVRERHSEGRRSSLRVAKHGVLWVQVVRPRLRRSLHATWNSLKSREERRPTGLQPPIPLPLLCVMVCKARLIAQEANDHRSCDVWMIFSALLLVGFLDS